MGTRGLIAYRYKGLYYVSYNHFDSYPDGLGHALIVSIPRDEKSFKKWLEYIKNHREQVKLQIEAAGDDFREDDFHLDRRPAANPPMVFGDIEYTYTIDLDRLAFSVDSFAHFRLNNIPRGGGTRGTKWIKYLYVDGSNTRCLDPMMPSKYLCQLRPDSTPSPEGITAYKELHSSITIIDESEWMSEAQIVSQELAIMIATSLVKDNYGKLSNLEQFAPEDKAFKVPAMTLLSAAAPNHAHLMPLAVDEDPTPLLKVAVTRKNKKTTYVPATPEFVLNCKTDALIYWFRGCMVVLCAHRVLLLKEHLMAQIGAFVNRVRKMKLQKCVGLLWSVRHVMVITVDGDDVSRSEPIPVLDSLKYGKQAAEKLRSAFSLLAHYLQPYSGNDVDAQKFTYGPPAENAAMVDLGPTNKVLPMDIILHIMGYLTISDYRKFRLISRALRAEWMRYPIVGKHNLKLLSWKGNGICRASFRNVCLHNEVQLVYHVSGPSSFGKKALAELMDTLEHQSLFLPADNFRGSFALARIGQHKRPYINIYGSPIPLTPKELSLLKDAPYRKA